MKKHYEKTRWKFLFHNIKSEFHLLLSWLSFVLLLHDNNNAIRWIYLHICSYTLTSVNVKCLLEVNSVGNLMWSKRWERNEMKERKKFFLISKHTQQLNDLNLIGQVQHWLGSTRENFFVNKFIFLFNYFFQVKNHFSDSEFFFVKFNVFGYKLFVSSKTLSQTWFS